MRLTGQEVEGWAALLGGLLWTVCPKSPVKNSHLSHSPGAHMPESANGPKSLQEPEAPALPFTPELGGLQAKAKGWEVGQAQRFLT